MSLPAAPSPDAEKNSGRLYIELPREKIAMMRFLLEGESHLAVMTILDPYRAVARLLHAPGSREAVARFVASTRELTGAEIINLPG